MKPWRTWSARLGAFGALAIVFGCGSGDVPDPGSDGQVAALPESSGPAQSVAPAPAPEPKVAAEEAKAEEPKPEEATAQAEPAAPAREPAGAGTSGGTATPDRSSATAEMLAMATKEQPAPPPAAGEPAQGGAPGPGGGPANMGPNAPGASGPGMAPGGMGAGMQGMQGQMQQQQQMQANQMAQMKNGMQNQMAQMRGQMQPGGAGAPPGMGGMGGPGGNNDKAPDFRRPEGAVEAFLSALKAKDLNRLSDATALRAGTNEDTAKRNQDMFHRVIEGTLSESELNNLAASLEGYKVSGFNQAKSSGKLGVILSKTGENRSRWTIVVTVRREKKGWGVCDISRPAALKNPSYGMPARQSKRT